MREDQTESQVLHQSGPHTLNGVPAEPHTAFGQVFVYYGYACTRVYNTMQDIQGDNMHRIDDSRVQYSAGWLGFYASACRLQITPTHKLTS